MENRAIPGSKSKRFLGKRRECNGIFVSENRILQRLIRIVTFAYARARACMSCIPFDVSVTRRGELVGRFSI